MRVVASLDDWLNALRDGEIECCTPRGAVSTLGALYVREMLEIGREEFPDHELVLWADCGEDRGAALAAIRNKLPHIIFSGEDETFVKLNDMAEQAGLVMREGV